MRIFYPLPRTTNFSLIIAFICAIFLFFLSSKNNFPIPWEDESSFILQAISWSENSTLFSHALNDERIVLWMQPGYMLLTGTIFKVIGYSFDIARKISWFFYLTSFIVFTHVVNKISTSTAFFSTLILGLIYLLPSSVAIGNVARMESLILLIFAIVFYFLTKRRIVGSIAVTIIGCLIHFNSGYLFFSIVGFILLIILFDRNSFLIKPKTWELVLLFISFVFVFLYIYFIYVNYESFKIDMTYQFSRKLARNSFFSSFWNNSFVFILLALIVLSIYKKLINLALIGLISLSFFLAYAIGQEMWYAIYLNLSLGLFFILTFNLVPSRFAIKPAVFAIFLMVNIKITFSGFAGMSPFFFKQPYIDELTLNKIQRNILSLKDKDNLTITFMSKGVDLIFYPFLKENNLALKHKLPNEIQKEKSSDICVYITRPNDPLWISSHHKIPVVKDCNFGLIISEKNGDVRLYKSQGNQFIPAEI